MPARNRNSLKNTLLNVDAHPWTNKIKALCYLIEISTLFNQIFMIKLLTRNRN